MFINIEIYRAIKLIFKSGDTFPYEKQISTFIDFIIKIFLRPKNDDIYKMLVKEIQDSLS